MKQPWATLLVAGVTRYVVRDWRTFHRGPLAIHAGGDFPRANVLLCNDPAMRPFLNRAGLEYVIELPTQAVVGIVTVADCVPVRDEDHPSLDPTDPAVYFGQLQPGRWAWLCTQPRRLDRPIPVTGRLGLFNVPESLVTSH